MDTKRDRDHLDELWNREEAPWQVYKNWKLFDYLNLV